MPVPGALCPDGSGAGYNCSTPASSGDNASTIHPTQIQAQQSLQHTPGTLSIFLWALRVWRACLGGGKPEGKGSEQAASFHRVDSQMVLLSLVAGTRRNLSVLLKIRLERLQVVLRSPGEHGGESVREMLSHQVK